MKNPLWLPPEKWRVLASPTKRPASPRKNDEKLAELIQRAKNRAALRVVR